MRRHWKSGWSWVGMLVALVSVRAVAEEANVPVTPAEIWPRIARDFQPPEELANDCGEYRSPMKFYDGRPVRTAEDWAERREEILRRWHEQMYLFFAWFLQHGGLEQR